MPDSALRRTVTALRIDRRASRSHQAAWPPSQASREECVHMNDVPETKTRTRRKLKWVLGGATAALAAATAIVVTTPGTAQAAIISN